MNDWEEELLGMMMEVNFEAFEIVVIYNAIAITK
jgi:hypothetical protein